MSGKLRFARDFPEVCDLWKSFDTRPRYNADNMMQSYLAGYAAALESRPVPSCSPRWVTTSAGSFCDRCGVED